MEVPGEISTLYGVDEICIKQYLMTDKTGLIRAQDLTRTVINDKMSMYGKCFAISNNMGFAVVAKCTKVELTINHDYQVICELIFNGLIEKL